MREAMRTQSTRLDGEAEHTVVLGQEAEAPLGPVLPAMPSTIGRYRVTRELARALVASGRDRERALELVCKGIETWGESADELHQSQVADMRKWLAVHESLQTNNRQLGEHPP